MNNVFVRRDVGRGIRLQAEGKYFQHLLKYVCEKLIQTAIH